MLEALGGQCACSPRRVGERSDAVFIMVMNGQQVLEVMTGNDGLLKSLKPGATIILTATVEPDDARAATRVLEETGIDIIDAPVTGGKSGAEKGTLTLMAAAPEPN